MNKFTHIDKNGNAVMVDVSEKSDTAREASAEGFIKLNSECFNAVLNGAVKKGDVLAVAQIAGITGAKRASELIPLCHIINLTNVSVIFEPLPEQNKIRAECKAKCTGKTGVEMEALTGVMTALLTIYDMCKAIDKYMEISDVRLIEKSGGRSGHFKR